MIRLPQTSLSCKSLIASCLPSSVSKTTKPKPLGVPKKKKKKSFRVSFCLLKMQKHAACAAGRGRRRHGGEGGSKRTSTFR